MGDNKGLDEDLEIEESEEPTEYDESTWGKKVDGQFVIDGYKFKGKQSFRKSKEYLENLMVKGAKGEINGSSYRILDARLKGIEKEVDLKITECTKTGIENSGTAIVKIYGPNKRKENSVTVTKSKKSDIKFVAIIAQKIIRPLIKQSLTPDMNSKIKQETLTKCKICDKTFRTIRGLKGHNTRIHKGQNNDQQTDNIEPAFDISDEDEIDEDCIEKVNSNKTNDKKYHSQCTECSYEIETNRKYELIQNSLKHKAECKKVNSDCKESHVRGACNVCGFVARSELTIKRHLRDKHDITTVSTSPPQKKTKIIVQESKTEEMEIDTNEILDAENKEDMEIDSVEIQRSNEMDEKVIAKAKKIDEEERLLKNKRKLKEMKDKELEELEKEKLKMLTKQKKQRLKDEKKRIRKKSIKASKVDTNMMVNIKPIPENISHLVNRGDVIYTVPGDGSCGPSSAAAFLFKDEVFGTQLKRKTNRFLAKHWEKKYKFKSQCSEDSPFVRQVGRGEEVCFTDPEKLIQYLNKSEEAVYMWSDSEDFAVISDMYQIRIKIITTKGPTDENPTVNWILPDEDMKEHAELKGVHLDEMVLFHENDMHFNLIVSENDDLVTMGSLSYRTNIGPYMKSTDKDEVKSKDQEADNKSAEKENKILTDQIKQLKEKITFLEKDYQECEHELKSKSEEIEHLKIKMRAQEEIKILDEKSKEIQEKTTKKSEVGKSCGKSNSVDLTRKVMQDHTRKEHRKDEMPKCPECNFEVWSISQLVEHIIRNHGLDTINNIKWTDFEYKCATETQLSEHTKNEHDKEFEFKCGLCKFKGKNKYHLDAHISSEHTNDNKFECDKCDFLGGDENDFKTHLESTHEDEEYNCNQCCFQGTTSRELKKHIILQHMINCTECNFYCDNKRDFGRHKLLIHANKDIIRCRICGETLETKADLMKHRKTEHPKTVAHCKNIKEGECPFSNEDCWWNHETQPQNEKKCEGNFKCYTCNETFNTKPTLMFHKKEKHRHLVRGCNLFIDNRCPYNDSKCWFIHEDNFDQGEDIQGEEKEEQESDKSVFQEVQENLEPPLNSDKNNEKMNIKL